MWSRAGEKIGTIKTRGNNMEILKNGGTAVVCGLPVKTFDEKLRENPQLIFWGEDEIGELPANCKALVMGTQIAHKHANMLVEQAKKLRAVIWRNESPNRIKQLLDSMVDKEPEKKAGRPKNWLTLYVEKNYDGTKIPVSEGERIFELAKQEGLETTKGSIIQAIYKIRKNKNLGTIPKSIKPKSLVLKEVLDEAIVNLTSIRDSLIQFEEENNALRARIDSIERVVKGV